MYLIIGGHLRVCLPEERRGDKSRAWGLCGDCKTLIWERDKQNLGRCLCIWDLKESEKLTGHILTIWHDNPLYSVSGNIQ